MKGMKRQFSELSNQVIGCAIEVHRVLGNRTFPLAFGRPFNRMIQDRFILRVPVKLLALAISAGGHDDGYRMSISVENRGVWFFPAAQTSQPVGHVGKIFVANERWGNLVIAR